MVLFPSWLPSDRITEPPDHVVSDAIRDAALETDALALESELRYALILLGVSDLSIVEIFDQARYEARMRAPHASAFSVRHQAATDVRVILRNLVRNAAASL